MYATLGKVKKNACLITWLEYAKFSLYEKWNNCHRPSENTPQRRRYKLWNAFMYFFKFILKEFKRKINFVSSSCVGLKYRFKCNKKIIIHELAKEESAIWCLDKHKQKKHTYTHTYTHIHTYTYTHTHTHIHTHTSVSAWAMYATLWKVKKKIMFDYLARIRQVLTLREVE